MAAEFVRGWFERRSRGGRWRCRGCGAEELSPTGLVVSRFRRNTPIRFPEVAATGAPWDGKCAFSAGPNGKNHPVALGLQRVGMRLIKIDDHTGDHWRGAVLAGPHPANALRHGNALRCCRCRWCPGKSMRIRSGLTAVSTEATFTGELSVTSTRRSAPSAHRGHMLHRSRLRCCSEPQHKTTRAAGSQDVFELPSFVS